MAVDVAVVDGHVGLVTVTNGPLNVLSRSTYEQLDKAVGAIEDDGQIRAVVVRGGGTRAFSAGDDVTELRQLAGAEQVRERLSFENDVMDRLAGLSRPTIAALGGYVLGGGLELALACDLRVAGEQCLVGFPEITLGLFPGSGGMLRIGQVSSIGWARRLLFFGDLIPADQARAAGLVDEVVGADPLGRALELARRLAASSATALQSIKAVLGATGPMSHQQKRQFVLDRSVAVFGTRDAQDRLAAFGSRRPNQP